MTKEKFLRYENLRKSGKYNMIMDMSHVLIEAELNYHDYLDIISNYSTYYKKYIG